jgi:environmental stress-induced protein Ves
MEYRIIPCEKFKSVTWPGGKTTQLFIFPPTADYRQQNFSFRISTATVEAETSEFTSLPGISRKLMVLEGTTNLYHQGHHSRQLHKFDVDEFEGDWKTTSVGKCTDFNLMTTGKTNGNLKAMVIETNQQLNYATKENLDWVFLYVFKGTVKVTINNKMSIINKGDLLVIMKPMTYFEMNGLENSELVFAEIQLNE